MCHVLIIEDEPVVAMDLQMLLEAEGATSIDIAASEAEAIAAARMHRPGFITSDVKLPQGTGPHAVRRIRDEHGDIPVILRRYDQPGDIPVPMQGCYSLARRSRSCRLAIGNGVFGRIPWPSLSCGTAPDQLRAFIRGVSSEHRTRTSVINTADHSSSKPRQVGRNPGELFAIQFSVGNGSDLPQAHHFV
jgi:CheY-like chemotaxis protein